MYLMTNAASPKRSEYPTDLAFITAFYTWRDAMTVTARGADFDVARAFRSALRQ